MDKYWLKKFFGPEISCYKWKKRWIEVYGTFFVFTSIYEYVYGATAATTHAQDTAVFSSCVARLSRIGRRGELSNMTQGLKCWSGRLPTPNMLYSQPIYTCFRHFYSSLCFRLDVICSPFFSASSQCTNCSFLDPNFASRQLGFECIQCNVHINEIAVHKG